MNVERPHGSDRLLSYHGLPARGVRSSVERRLEACDTRRRSSVRYRCGRPGFSFTEILFAVLILGIGFILVAGIFPVAIRQTQATAEETTAATIARGGVAYLEKFSPQSYWGLPTWAVGGNYPAGTQVLSGGMAYTSILSNIGTASNTPPNATYWTAATGALPPIPDGQVHLIAPVVAASEMPPTPTSPATNTAFWPLISGNLILPSDNRYAWIPMYRQDPTWIGKYVQVIVIGVQARNRTLYDAADLAVRGASAPATLQARPLQANFVRNSNGTPPQPDLVTLSELGANATTPNLGAAIEGSYIIVANDGAAPGAPTTNGFIYRLGNPTNTANQFELAPGNDMTGASVVPPTSPVSVYLIGRGYDDANSTNYSGPAQDIAAYSTFLIVH